MIIVNESAPFRTSMRNILYNQLEKQLPNEMKIFVTFDSNSDAYNVVNNSHYFSSTSNYHPMAYFDFLKHNRIFQNFRDEPCFILQDFTLLAPSFGTKYIKYMNDVENNKSNIFLPHESPIFNEVAVLYSEVIKSVDFSKTVSLGEFNQWKEKNIIPHDSIIVDKIRNHPMLIVENVPNVYEYDPDQSYSRLDPLKVKCVSFATNKLDMNRLYKYLLDERTLYINGSYFPEFSIINCKKITEYTGKYSIERQLEINTINGDFIA